MTGAPTTASLSRSPPTARGEGRVYVIGAGLAGLAAATRLSSRGARVVVLEAAAQAGGRCRSYHDPKLDLVIDNGNHLVMSGNAAVAAYLRLIGAEEHLTGPSAAAFPFVDLASGESWTIRPNPSALPWWIAAPSRRPPGVKAADFLGLWRLLAPPEGRVVPDVVATTGPLWRRLMEPFLVAALNTDPADSDAGLAAAIVRETLARGGDAYRPRVATPTLAAAFVDPALALLAARGAKVRFGARVRRILTTGDRVTGLSLPDETLDIGPADRVIFAAPPWAAAELLPEIPAPTEFRAIVNGHFRLTPPPGLPSLMGVLGGAVEWIFVFEDRIGVTISNADRWIDHDRDALAERLWRDVAQALALPPQTPPWQIVKEKRATFAATVEQNRKRPRATTALSNLVLAGDWVQTGLPATIEGALRSGFTAADLSSAAASV